MRPIIVAAVLTFLTPDLAGAHSFWLEPSSFEPEPEAMIALKILVGENFNGEELVRHPSHLRTFTLTTPEKKDLLLDIPGRPGSRPAGYLRIAERKPYIVSYTSNATEAVLSADTFRAYIESEGLAKHIPLEKLGRSEVKEQYARNAKTLLIPTGFKGSPVDRAVGLPLELVCLCDALTLNGANSEIPLRWQLLSNGRPLVDHMVFLERKEEHRVTMSASTDKKGEVLLPVSMAGTYLVRSIEMVAGEKGGPNWRSQWTSTSFLVASLKDKK